MAAMTGLSAMSGLSGLFNDGGFLPSNIAGLDLWMDASQGLGSGGSRKITASDKAFFSTASAVMEDGAKSFGMWIYLEAIPSVTVSFAGQHSGGSHRWGMRITSAGTTDFTVNGFSTRVSTGVLSANKWYFLVGTYDGSDLRYYLDGSLVDGPTSSGQATGFTSPSFELGGQDGASRYVDARFAKVFVANTALNTSQITDLYNSGNGQLRAEIGSGIPSNLVSYWNCNEGDATDDLADSEGSNDLSIAVEELVTNGTFATDTDWSKGTGWSIGSGVASCDGSQVSDSLLFQVLSLTVGDNYLTSFEVSNYSAGNVNIFAGGTDGASRSANGTYVETLEWGGASSTVRCVADSNFVGDVDNVSIKATGINVAQGPRAVNARDISGNGNHGVLNGSTTVDDWVNDIPSNTTASVYSLDFDGVDDYVEIPDASELDVTNISLSYWVKFDTLANVGTISKREQFNIDYAYSSGLNGSNQIFFGVSTDGVNTTTVTTAAVSVNTWYHVVGTYDGSDVKIYLNGVESSSASETGSIHNSSISLKIGATNDPAAAFLNGKISDVRLYSDALTSDEVTYIHTNGTSGTDPTNTNLVGNWPLDDGPQSVSGISDGDTVLSWRSREGNNRLFQQATASKRPLYVASGIGGNPAIDLDGADDFLLLSSVPLSGVAGTIFIVATTDSIQDDHLFVVADNASTTRYLSMVGLENTGDLTQYQQRNNDTADTLTGSTDLAESTTYIFMTRCTGSAVNMRINGSDETLSGTNSGDWIDDTSNLDHIAIGALVRSSELNHWNGKVAEILYYNTALSSADISQVESYLADKYGVSI
jgi:hypothetical protein